MTFPESLTLGHGEAVLREWRAGDAPALEPVCGDPFLMSVTAIPASYSEPAAREWIERRQERHAAGTVLSLAITRLGWEEEALGDVLLFNFGADGTEAELGYWLLPAARGKGLATEASSALSRWGFSALGLERIELVIPLANAPSHAVAERLRAVREERTVEGAAVYSLRPG
jgi:ribosomal-protein-alanine N-acetyltransferase